eukprot:scaffold48935_cov49-Cyclotella_meneghiniana.AAC.1
MSLDGSRLLLFYLAFQPCWWAVIEKKGRGKEGKREKRRRKEREKKGRYLSLNLESSRKSRRLVDRNNMIETNYKLNRSFLQGIVKVVVSGYNGVMKPTNTLKFSAEDCIEMMQESLDHMTPNYVDCDNVIELPFHDTPSVSIELPSLLDDLSTDSNGSGLFSGIGSEILQQIDEFIQREVDSESSVLQFESNPTNSKTEHPNNNCIVDGQFYHYHQCLHHKYYPPSCPYPYPYSRDYVCQVDRQLSELSDRCSRLEQLKESQQAELTEIKKRCALLEQANRECKKKTFEDTRGAGDGVYLLAQVNAKQEAELTNLKQQCASLQCANSEYMKRQFENERRINDLDSLLMKRNKRAKHTYQYPNPTVKVPKQQCSNTVKKMRKRGIYHCGVCGMAGCSGISNNTLCPKRRALVKAMQPPAKEYTLQCSICSPYGPHWLNCGVGAYIRKNCRNYTISDEDCGLTVATEKCDSESIDCTQHACPAAGRAALMVDVNHPSLGWM